LGGLAVRDAPPAGAAGRAPGSSGRCYPRRSRCRPRPSASTLRRPVRPGVAVLDGLARRADRAGGLRSVRAALAGPPPPPPPPPPPAAARRRRAEVHGRL